MERRVARRSTGPSALSGPGLSGGSTSVPALLVKIVALGTIVGLAVTLTPALVGTQRWAFLAVIWGVVLVLVVTYATKRFIPAKYLVPGVLFLVLFVVYPILLTFQLSTTNFGDGTRTTKEVTVARIIGSSARQVEGARTFDLSVGTRRARRRPARSRSCWSTRTRGDVVRRHGGRPRASSTPTR